MKFYSNNHSFSACQLRFCGAVRTRHSNVYMRVRRTLFQRSRRYSRYMDTILLLRFDETYEPTFHRLHCAKPFSYVHLTVSSTYMKQRKCFRSCLSRKTSRKSMNIDIAAIVRIKTFAFVRDCMRENTLKKILFYRDSLNANFSETLP